MYVCVCVCMYVVCLYVCAITVCLSVRLSVYMARTMLQLHLILCISLLKKKLPRDGVGLRCAWSGTTPRDGTLHAGFTKRVLCYILTQYHSSPSVLPRHYSTINAFTCSVCILSCVDSTHWKKTRMPNPTLFR